MWLNMHVAQRELTVLIRYSFPPRARAVEWITGTCTFIILLPDVK